MADIERILSGMGAVPRGATPKTIPAEGGEAQWQANDPFSKALRIINKFQTERQMDQLKQQKLMQNDFDMYKTLRDSGYSSADAYDAIQKRKLPSSAPGLTLKDQEAQADIEYKKARTKEISEGTGSLSDIKAKILDKVASGEELTTGEQSIYDDIIKRKSDTSLDSILSKRTPPAIKTPPTKEGIMAKIANGGILTPGEQKIYDETIKKSSNGSALEDALSKGTGGVVDIKSKILQKIANGEELTSGEDKIYNDVIKKSAASSPLEDALNGTGNAEYVPMLKPDGTPTRVHKDDVTKALSKGYKRR